MLRKRKWREFHLTGPGRPLTDKRAEGLHLGDEMVLVRSLAGGWGALPVWVTAEEPLALSLGSPDPVQNVVQVLEKQYLEEKRSALEEQRLMYERELEQLRQQLSPERQPQISGPDRLAYSSQTAQQKVTQWAEER